MRREEIGEPTETATLPAAGIDTQAAWESLGAAVRALEAVEETRSRALYRVAMGVVVARADAYAKAARTLAEALGE